MVPLVRPETPVWQVVLAPSHRVRTLLLRKVRGPSPGYVPNQRQSQGWRAADRLERLFREPRLPGIV